MYLSCGTRPDIAFVMGQLSRHNLNPHIGYLNITKQVFHYLKDIITLSIEWRNDLAGHKAGEKYEEMGIMGYVDSSYAGDIEDRKSIIRYYFFFGKGIII